jgi:hypothetical protein
VKYANKVYLDFSLHDQWKTHYTEGNYRNWFLGFSKDFMNGFLPSWLPGDTFDVELVDTEDNNKIYLVAWSGGYEEYPEQGTILDKSGNRPEIYTIFRYSYEEKFCACNRKAEAARAGAILDNDECEGNRFQIRSVTCKEFPDLILYSETLDWEKLEELLLQEKSL